MVEKAKTPEPIRIGLMGDVMLGRLVDAQVNALKKKDRAAAWRYPWGNTLSLLQKNHLNLINLETAVTTSEQAWPKVFNFKASPSNIDVLKEGQVSIVNLANNHVLDFGPEGLGQTLAALKAAKIPYVGAGQDINEARQMHLIEQGGVRIGIVGATDNEPGWLATHDHAGTNYIRVGDQLAVESWIKKAKSQADFLILSLHWGPNNRERPSELFKRFAHFMIDSGIDVIHGHSAHIFQGVEHYKEGLIIYDSGDFIDDYRVDPILRNDQSFLFVMELAGSRWRRLTMYPVLIDHMQVNLLSSEDAKASLSRMIELSRELNTDVLEQSGHLVIERVR